MTTGRLDGRGILITRPARQAAGLAQEIAAIGGAPFIFPAIVILPPPDRRALDRAQSELDRYDYAVFVSANAVEYGVGAPLAWPRRLVAFAPGPGTLAALSAVGIDNARMPSKRMDSEGLLELPELTEVAGKRVLVFRGGGGRELLADTLAARGATVDVVDCYARAAPSAGAGGLSEALAAGRIDASTFTSSEGADNLWALLDAAARERIAGIAAFAPHERIAQRLRALGFRFVVVTEPSDAGLIAALLRRFAAGGY
ncbi:MAG: uroporphyrinogen-III synthase [Betaproteobacteria bacterium]